MSAGLYNYSQATTACISHLIAIEARLQFPYPDGCQCFCGYGRGMVFARLDVSIHIGTTGRKMDKKSIGIGTFALLRSRHVRQCQRSKCSCAEWSAVTAWPLRG